MTLTVVCGDSHISEYDLCTIPPKRTVKDSEGDLFSVPFDWDVWRCKVYDCSHPEHVSHVLNNYLEGLFDE
jgi:hypothetical protein